MSKERDERPLAEIRFALEQGEEQQEIVRNLLRACGVQIAQDIVEAGCTGLFLLLKKLPLDPSTGPLYEACFIRQRMSGSICGLPCYVPRDRYCLVHDTIGGLQLAGNQDGPQLQRYPEALPHMSRELTEDERKRVLGITAKLNADARQKALAEYGAGDIEESEGTLSDIPQSCPVQQPPFKCPDHAEPDWTCRKCIAQAIVEAPGHLDNAIDVCADNQSWGDLKTALVELGASRVDSVELWVRVASWSKKVTRD